MILGHDRSNIDLRRRRAARSRNPLHTRRIDAGVPRKARVRDRRKSPQAHRNGNRGRRACHRTQIRCWQCKERLVTCIKLPTSNKLRAVLGVLDRTTSLGEAEDMGHYKSKRSGPGVQPLRGSRTGEATERRRLGRPGCRQLSATCWQRSHAWPRDRLANLSPMRTATPPVFDPETHTVALPESFKKSFKALWDAEWYRMGLSEEVGGVPVPRSVVWAIGELILGAQPAAHMYQAGPAFADVLFNNGTEEQKKWAATIVERGWGATDGPHRARRRLRRRCRTHQGDQAGRRLLAHRGASSASSPRPTRTTCSRTSSTSFSLAPKAPDRAPRA